METTGSVSSPASDRVAKILLVEDVQDVRESIKLQLEDEGYEVIEAESSEQALQLLDRGKKDDTEEQSLHHCRCGVRVFG